MTLKKSTSRELGSTSGPLEHKKNTIELPSHIYKEEKILLLILSRYGERSFSAYQMVNFEKLKFIFSLHSFVEFWIFLH